MPKLIQRVARWIPSQATISGMGTSAVTVNQTSANAFINWTTFSIPSGQTVTFNQPTASSVAWNFVTGNRVSVINGELGANGMVVLQNPSGITINSSAVINAHGVVLTTASTPNLNLSSSGPWSFSAPPPSIPIINYGTINIAGGGTAYLIANVIQNNGKISAPGGNIGLYDGETILVSTSPDGRGLSAQVTLPQGSVDNEGNLIADAGSIIAQAQTVNQNGLMQADSVQNVNGTIELVASGSSGSSGSVTLGASSTISAHGDNTQGAGASAGGSVIIQSGGAFSDTGGSMINVSGGTGGGNGGSVEISAPQMGNISSAVTGTAQHTFTGGTLTLDTSDITIDDNYAKTLNNEAQNGGLSAISLKASDSIAVNTAWTLPDSGPATLNLTAGNNITIGDGDAVSSFNTDGKDWTLNLTAGTALPAGTIPTSGNYGIYLIGNGAVYTYSGDINVWAANEVIVNGGDIGGIATLGGGNISVTAQYGDVNTGNNVNGYDFSSGGYAVDSFVGGISTAAGGNVTINAGQDVISYLPVQNAWNDAAGDPGTGTFSPNKSGNLTITAGRNIYGNYVVGDGTGKITAGGDVGVGLSSKNLTTESFALSLINAQCSVYAPNGNIYVQDIDNPNGIFNDASIKGSAYHKFDASYADSSVLLDAADNVEITGFQAPQAAPSVLQSGTTIPMWVPSSFSVIAGDNFTMDSTVILFPSPDQILNIDVKTGNFIGAPGSNPANNGNPIELIMSDSPATQWLPSTASGWTPANKFSDSYVSDYTVTPPEMNNPNTPTIFVGGDLSDMNLFTDMRTAMTVIGNMENSSFLGENLHPTDHTSIDVHGEIEYSPLYAFAPVASTITSAEPFQPTIWDSAFDYAVNPDELSKLASIDFNSPTVEAAIQSAGGLAGYLSANGYLLFPSASKTAFVGNPGLVYDPNSLQIGFKGQMSLGLEDLLEANSFTVLLVDSKGNPILNSSGNIQTTGYSFNVSNWSTAIASLYKGSQDNIDPTSLEVGIQIGGPGYLDVTAGSMNLGNSDGIISDGFGSYGPGSPNYTSLVGLCGLLASGGASVTINTSGDLDMISSAICSIDGGDVDVTSGANINLSQGTFSFQTDTAYGIWTSGHSDVNVLAQDDINIGSSRIGTFDGGDVSVISDFGNIDCGFGANIALYIPGAFLNDGVPTINFFGELDNIEALIKNPAPYGSGILAEYPTALYQTPGKSGPGNITVKALHGNITSVLGGIQQFALDAKIGGGPTVTLYAGGSPPNEGNITLGDGGIIGGTIDITASGNVQGLVISTANANINAGESFSGTVLAGGTANFTGGGTISGTVIGIGGINTGSSSLGNVTLLSQNVSVGGGASQSTLGTSTGASVASQAASQQTTQQTTKMIAVNSDEDDKKKNKKKATIHVGRVTVILSSAVPK